MAETAPSWEQIVERVTISSNYLAVRFAEAKWREAFRQSRQVAELIRDDLSRRNAASWKGPGAEAFRAHLGELAKVLDLNAEKHDKIANSSNHPDDSNRASGLKRCADALEQAVKTIPVPSWLYDEVKQRQLDFALNGVPPNIQPHWFWQELVGPNPQGWTGEALKEAEQICRQAEATARQIYERLCEVYREEAARMPEGTPVPVPAVNQPVGTGRAGTRSSTGPANTATAQQPPTPPPSATTPPPTAPGGLTSPPPLDTPPLDTPPLTTLPDPDDLDTSPSDFGSGGLGTGDFGRGTGLAGIGGGFGGGFGGAGGLGDRMGIGSTAGPGSPGMGPAVPLPPGVLAARAAAGTGVGAGIGMMPFAPMMGGGHGAGDSGQQTHGVKLQEDDEDIFRPRQASSCVIDV